MSIFTKVDGWFKKQEASIEKLFTRIEPLVSKAEPIVEEISAVTASAALDFPALAGEAAIFAAIVAYLKKAVGVESVVNTFIADNEHVPVNNLLHNAATLALEYTHGEAAVAVSDLDTAVQVAYSAIKSSTAGPSFAAPAAVPTPAPIVVLK